MLENEMDFENRIIAPEYASMEDAEVETSLRPRTLGEYIGQEKAKENLSIFMQSAKLRGEALDAYLFDKLGPYLKVPVDAIVLGCTHYPFLTGAIRRIVGRGPEILDGSHGVAMQLGRRLAAAGMLRTQGGAGTVEFRNSLDEPEILALSRTLLQYRED